LFFLKNLNADFLREFKLFSSSDSLETQLVVGGSLVIRKSESAFMLCRLASKVASSWGACCTLPLESRIEGRLVFDVFVEFHRFKDASAAATLAGTGLVCGRP
jgi:hypothetical protein